MQFYPLLELHVGAIFTSLCLYTYVILSLIGLIWRVGSKFCRSLFLVKLYACYLIYHVDFIDACFFHRHYFCFNAMLIKQIYIKPVRGHPLLRNSESTKEVMTIFLWRRSSSIILDIVCTTRFIACFFHFFPFFSFCFFFCSPKLIEINKWQAINTIIDVFHKNRFTTSPENLVISILQIACESIVNNYASKGFILPLIGKFVYSPFLFFFLT